MELQYVVLAEPLHLVRSLGSMELLPTLPDHRPVPDLDHDPVCGP
jgi:hypothetical protein